MWFACACGAQIKDITDNLPDKAYLIPDQAWFALSETSSPVDGHALIGRARPVYQCRSCGRLHIGAAPGGRLISFMPESDHARVILAESPVRPSKTR
jgi:hypothetical protein